MQAFLTTGGVGSRWGRLGNGDRTYRDNDAYHSNAEAIGTGYAISLVGHINPQ